MIFDQVLGRENDKRVEDDGSVDGDAFFAHRPAAPTGSRRGPVDLVGEHDVGKQRPRVKGKSRRLKM